MAPEKNIQLGLKENWKQFTLLVIVNAFVGGMVGLERTILPEIATEEFGMAVKTAILSFIVVFGTIKAVSNYFAGSLSNRFGRKKILITGWIFAIPVPFILMYAETWTGIVVANVFLGINQGLAWSSTVIMKIDLVGEKQRGFAMGLNEFAGYLAVAVVAFVTGYIANHYGVRPYPFYLGFALIGLGLFFSLFLVKDTRQHNKAEIKSNGVQQLRHVFLDTSLKNRNLSSVTQAGLVNNLNDGMIWGIFPLLLASLNFDLEAVGVVVAVYPAVWGIGQLFTGRLADIYSKKYLLFTGMLLQAVVLVLIAFTSSFYGFVFLSAFLGLGTAMVYPTFLASVADHTHPTDRAASVGVFRLWRDLGYAVGALLTGYIADQFGMFEAIISIGVLTFISSLIILFRMQEKR